MARWLTTRALAYAWVVLLTLGVLGPALLPGFVLSYDLVFTPRQDLLPAFLGVGSGLPRAVPQDAVVAILETVVPGMVLEKIALAGALLLVGCGMLRLVSGTAAGVVAATLAMANPYVLQRLVIGHWGLLLAYALVPWALVIARRLRGSGDAWDGVRLLLLCAAGSLTPSGSLLVALVAVPPALLPGSAYDVRRRIALAAAVVAAWIPWLLPSLLHPAALPGAANGGQGLGTQVFALRPEGPLGAVGSAITGGGIWNGQVVLPSRDSALAIALAVLVIGLAAWGLPRLRSQMGTAVAAWWGLIAVLGLVAALASALLPGPWALAIDALPGGGLGRDAHKLLAPWVLLVAAAAGLGAGRLVHSVRDRGARVGAVLALALIPLALQPDAFAGAGGRLVAVDYPQDWQSVRATLATDPRPGDVASFPWTSFRAFEWNDRRTVLDPAPRWLPRTTVVSDDLIVDTPSGPVVVAGEDPRSQDVSDALARGGDVGQVLTAAGIGWALVAEGTPGPVPQLIGWRLAFAGPDLRLWAAPEGSVRLRSVDARPVAAADAVVAAGLLVALLALVLRRVRARRPETLVA